MQSRMVNKTLKGTRKQLVSKRKMKTVGIRFMDVITSTILSHCQRDPYIIHLFPNHLQTQFRRKETINHQALIILLSFLRQRAHILPTAQLMHNLRKSLHNLHHLNLKMQKMNQSLVYKLKIRTHQLPTAIQVHQNKGKPKKLSLKRNRNLPWLSKNYLKLKMNKKLQKPKLKSI